MQNTIYKLSVGFLCAYLLLFMVQVFLTPTSALWESTALLFLMFGAVLLPIAALIILFAHAKRSLSTSASSRPVKYSGAQKVLVWLTMFCGAVLFVPVLVLGGLASLVDPGIGYLFFLFVPVYIIMSPVLLVCLIALGVVHYINNRSE